mmetsp:Transcript_70061/g.226700  ORF Transcript_70061/g.226700 Transcript_70061/m.226700 type:complete len:286 (-) Transcript_70061:194-1051(-)
MGCAGGAQQLVRQPVVRLSARLQQGLDACSELLEVVGRHLALVVDLLQGLFGLGALALVLARALAAAGPDQEPEAGGRRELLGHAAERRGAEGGLLQARRLLDQLLHHLAAAVVRALQQDLPARLRLRRLHDLCARHRGRGLAVAPVHHLGGRVHVLHDEDDVLEAELDRHLFALHHVLLVEHDVHQLLVGGDPGQRHVHNVPAGVLRHGLDEAGLAGARRPVQQEAELVRVARDGVLAGLLLEVLEDAQQRVLLVEEEAREGLVVAQLVALVDPLAGRLPVAAT